VKSRAKEEMKTETTYINIGSERPLIYARLIHKTHMLSIIGDSVDYPTLFGSPGHFLSESIDDDNFASSLKRPSTVFYGKSSIKDEKRLARERKRRKGRKRHGMCYGSLCFVSWQAVDGNA
jgi:hypothetical protein